MYLSFSPHYLAFIDLDNKRFRLGNRKKLEAFFTYIKINHHLQFRFDSLYEEEKKIND